jgi:hypothetical protein
MFFENIGHEGKMIPDFNLNKRIEPKKDPLPEYELYPR